MLRLKELGNRICIIGCSSSGKSTLANKLSKQLNIPTTHLDLLAHYQATDWQRKPEHEFITAHELVLQNDQWIIEGNYSICMSPRFANATSVIWLDYHVGIAAINYIKRCLGLYTERIGKLPGSSKEFDFRLLKHILLTYPKNRLHYRNLLQNIKVPIVIIHSMRELRKYYRYWEIID